jgi:hypothetical protein
MWRMIHCTSDIGHMTKGKSAVRDWTWVCRTAGFFPQHPLTKLWVTLILMIYEPFIFSWQPFKYRSKNQAKNICAAIYDICNWKHHTVSVHCSLVCCIQNVGKGVLLKNERNLIWVWGMHSSTVCCINSELIRGSGPFKQGWLGLDKGSALWANCRLGAEK